MIADTSRPSYAGLSLSTIPPEEPNPRGSQVTTLKPARSIVPTPGIPVEVSVESVALVSPGELQPGPSNTVEVRAPGLSPGAGK